MIHLRALLVAFANVWSHNTQAIFSRSFYEFVVDMTTWICNVGFLCLIISGSGKFEQTVTYYDVIGRVQRLPRISIIPVKLPWKPWQRYVDFSSNDIGRVTHLSAWNSKTRQLLKTSSLIKMDELASDIEIISGMMVYLSFHNVL